MGARTIKTSREKGDLGRQAVLPVPCSAAHRQAGGWLGAEAGEGASNHFPLTPIQHHFSNPGESVRGDVSQEDDRGFQERNLGGTGSKRELNMYPGMPLHPGGSIVPLNP